MHIPVLLQETIDGLDIKDGDVVLDMTLGGGGHAREIFLRGKRISYIGIDQDDYAIEQAQKNLKKWQGNIKFLKGNFKDAKEMLAKEGITHVSKILFDLGASSFQFDDPARGFSFLHDGPLSMKMSDQTLFSAEDIVNNWREEDIANVLYAYGEETRARKIAKAIVLARRKFAITTTTQLADIVMRAYGKAPRGRLHPATKTFQALRIAVNGELDALKRGLADSVDIFSPHGRIAVISFHSLEDRIVKSFMKDLSKEGWLLINKRPVVVTREEITQNPRSRSAKLRIIEKI
ncbi:MAG TPA: 16S rRNA (cytosine(1402)-N(4))-methyltransferase RsmH [Candidatus Paceibacterota bacterium]|nr:16S rRNA (cytosine(1402)-N(4))-methyltransferase RsmH [Candidatus Paceibacterota bacterium]